MLLNNYLILGKQKNKYMDESTVKTRRRFRSFSKLSEKELNDLREYARKNAPRVYPYASYDLEKESRLDRILTIVAVVLAVALIALCVYLAILLC